MYKRSISGWIKHIDFTLLDVVALQIAYILAFMIRFRTFSFPYQNDFYLSAAKVIIVVHIVISAFTSEYSGVVRRGFLKECRYCFLHSTVVFLVVNVYIIAMKWAEAYSRVFLYVYWAASFIILVLFRMLLKKIILKRMRIAKNRSVLMVVCKRDEAESIAERFEKDKFHEFVLGGFVFIDYDSVGETVRDIPVVSTLEDFYDYAKKSVVDEVFISDDNLKSAEEFAQELLDMGIAVHYRLIFGEEEKGNRIVEKYGGFSVLTVGMNIKYGPVLMVKRIIDILGSLVGLLATFICMLIFGPIIYIQSPGSIFFSQTRIGKNGRQFKIYKFRSMYPDAEKRKQELMAQNEMDGQMFKVANDPRIIPIGHFIRKHSIDELPQFFNVLKGDMSLVGTRPPTKDEFENYAIHHKARLGFAPGLTGLWQVSGRSQITDFEQVVKLDTEYITNWSLLLDLKIILKTIKIVFTGRGAS